MSEPHAIPETESDKKQGDKLDHVLDPKSVSPSETTDDGVRATPEAEPIK